MKQSVNNVNIEGIITITGDNVTLNNVNVISESTVLNISPEADNVVINGGVYNTTSNLQGQGTIRLDCTATSTCSNEITIKNATKESQELPIIAENSIISLVPTNIDIDSLEPVISITENLEAPISEGTILGSIKYTIDGIEYSTNLCAEHNVEKSDIVLLICQICGVIVILIILYKFLSHKSNIKNKKKSKHYKRQKDSIYKF